jgi:hypothetical protein
MLKPLAGACFLLAALSPPVLAHAAPRGEAKATVAGKAVSIDYGRPSLAGRDMLGKAEIGKPWRMGADGATTLTTEADLAFGAAAVPKGSYVLTATKTAEDRWVLNVATAEKAKVADVPLDTAKLGESVETLTIELRGEKGGGEFEMKWGTLSLRTAFTGK